WEPLSRSEDEQTGTCQGGHMLRRSVTRGARRRMALVRTRCAPFALVLIFSAWPLVLRAQTPALDGPSNIAVDRAAGPPLPAPAAPPVVPPQSPTPALKATEAKSSKPTDDLAAALERPGELNLHGVSLDKALFMIGDQWNINIVAGEVKGTVNGTFKQAPLRE